MAKLNKDDYSEIKITNVPKTVKSELDNIAKNQGIELGSFLKSQFRKILDSYPDTMKQKPRSY
jgi:hypothetical protein